VDRRRRGADGTLLLPIATIDCELASSDVIKCSWFYSPELNWRKHVRNHYFPPMNEFFLSALSFGLAAGLKPGPLGVLVIQQTLSKGLPAGVRASLAPLITDGPIIIAALWLLSQVKNIDVFAAVLSLFGGVYLLWLSAKMFRARQISLSGKLTVQGSLATAVKLNFLNPGPYLFWFTVGGSYIIRGSASESIVFVVTAIGTLIASKLAVALLAARFFPSLESRGYLVTMKLLAGSLVWFGLQSIARSAELGLHYARDF
jgi:threonine/homoserine/homoserine lactone efflux protein